jgi:polysaccharide export outer membrane protein
LRLSGGLTKRADADSLYIVKANGSTIVLDKSSFRIFGRRPDIGPGDTIVVPVNIQYKDSLQNWTEITQLIYQSMVSIAAVKGL